MVKGNNIIFRTTLVQTRIPFPFILKQPLPGPVKINSCFKETTPQSAVIHFLIFPLEFSIFEYYLKVYQEPSNSLH